MQASPPPPDSSAQPTGNGSGSSSAYQPYTGTAATTTAYLYELVLELARNGTNASELKLAYDEQGLSEFTLPWWRQLIWTVLFAVMIAVATSGNLIVIWIVLAHKRMRTVTNYFLVNLSIADAMVSTLNVIFSYTYMLNSHWPFGNLYCKISQFISVITICASVFTLMAISIDRQPTPRALADARKSPHFQPPDVRRAGGWLGPITERLFDRARQPSRSRAAGRGLNSGERRRSRALGANGYRAMEASRSRIFAGVEFEGSVLGGWGAFQISWFFLNFRAVYVGM